MPGIIWRAFDIPARWRSFRCALAGVGTLLGTQPNAIIHTCAVICTLGFGLFLRVSIVEWAILVLSMSAVWAAEALNTALERLADAVAPERHPLVKQAKDAAAAGVLITAAASVVIGILILGPPLAAYLRGLWVPLPH